MNLKKKPTVTWETLNFGKHKGKTLPQVMFQDPDWFFWAYKEEIFKSKKTILREQADEIFDKARNIKIPERLGENLVVQYLIHPPTGKFGKLEIVNNG